MEREREYWRTSGTERPGELAVSLLLRKMTEARVFVEALERNRPCFEAAQVVLEVGGGQGWAACLLKRELGESTQVMTSDIGTAAVESVPSWESVFQTRLDGAFACPALEIPLDASSVDLVFAFDAAHHFGAHRRTFTEIHRVLRPDGVCLYLHEPTVPRFFYRRAVERVNRKRAGYGHDVVEDVLVGDHLLSVARDVGFEAHRTFAPSLIDRGRKELLYYRVVRRLGSAQRWLPSTADFIFKKQPDPDPIR
jgi:SAM-dependent methyltransferase